MLTLKIKKKKLKDPNKIYISLIICSKPLLSFELNAPTDCFGEAHIVLTYMLQYMYIASCATHVWCLGIQVPLAR